jgi:hypothetical protein
VASQLAAGKLDEARHAPLAGPEAPAAGHSAPGGAVRVRLHGVYERAGDGGGRCWASPSHLAVPGGHLSVSCDGGVHRLRLTLR